MTKQQKTNIGLLQMHNKMFKHEKEKIDKYEKHMSKVMLEVAKIDGYYSGLIEHVGFTFLYAFDSNDQIIGTAIYSAISGMEYHIDYITVLEKFRNSGVANALLEWATQECLEKSFSVLLCVDKKYPWLSKWYKRKGWKQRYENNENWLYKGESLTKNSKVVKQFEENMKKLKDLIPKNLKTPDEIKEYLKSMYSGQICL